MVVTTIEACSVGPTWGFLGCLRSSCLICLICVRMCYVCLVCARLCFVGVRLCFGQGVFLCCLLQLLPFRFKRSLDRVLLQLSLLFLMFGLSWCLGYLMMTFEFEFLTLLGVSSRAYLFFLSSKIIWNVSMLYVFHVLTNLALMLICGFPGRSRFFKLFGLFQRSPVFIDCNSLETHGFLVR